jgi:hypothetical protein
MDDQRGGWKGLDTGLVRDHLHAATAVGRMAGAAKAAEIGYGIEADPGPSGRLGGWAIAGIPKDAWQVHAQRSAQIEAAVGPDASYRSRSVAARATRDRKAHDHVGDLVARWRAELARAGYPVAELEEAVDLAGRAYEPPGPAVVEDVAAQLLAPGGRLASEKTFTRGDVVVAMAPHLHGLPVSHLDGAVEAVLSHEQAVALPPVAGAREPVWAAACVLENEALIATLAERLVARAGPAIGPERAAEAVRQVELSGGFRLSEKQSELAQGILTSGHALDLIIGVAGSGKTSTLAALRAGFDAAGYQVVGAATSGQAAKALGSGAGVASRTVASLTWRLEHHQEALTPRHIVILDEASMTSDADVGKLLGAAEAAGAKLIAVGDYHQIGSVGPGGALEALAARHPGHVWTLMDNLRQADPAERHALDHLRSGHMPSAVAWYLLQGRVHPAPTRETAMAQMVKAWAYDVAGGGDALLIAYHRDAVEALNRAAREAWAKLGRLSGVELAAPGGRRYRAGDRVVTLAPGPGGAWVTSQRAEVRSVDVEGQSLTAVTPDGAELHLGPDDIGTDRLAHSYAMTAHRCQGSTTTSTYALEDGGGRELAYVAMSRARRESHVHVVAPDLGQAARNLAWAWAQDRRQAWTLAERREEVLAELMAERQRLLAALPPDPSHQLGQLRQEHSQAERDLSDLYQGAGRWTGTGAGEAAKALRRAAASHEEASAALARSGLWARHKARTQLDDAASRLVVAREAWDRAGEPHARRLGARRDRLADEVTELEQTHAVREAYLAQHPEVPRRLAELDGAIASGQGLDRLHRLALLRQRGQAQHRRFPPPSPGSRGRPLTPSVRVFWLSSK